MKSLSNVNGGLKWLQTGKLESQLLTKENETVAKLLWKNSWGSLATGESSEGKWTLKRSGFLRPKITIREPESDLNVGVMSMKFSGAGVLRLADGSIYHFNRSRNGMAIVNSVGDRVLGMKPLPSCASKEASIHFEGTKVNLSLLAILVWYVTLLISSYDSDASFVGALTAVMGSSV